MCEGFEGGGGLNFFRAATFLENYHLSERQDTSIHTFRTFLSIDPNALEKISTAVVFLQTAVRQTGLQLPNDFDRCASSLA